MIEDDVQTGSVTVALSRGEAGLVNEEFRGVEDACRLGEKLILRCAVRREVRLMERTRGLLNREILRKRRLPQLIDDALRRMPHRARFIHHTPGLI